MPGKEVDLDQILQSLPEMIEQLGVALRKLQIEGGPKLETEHIEMVCFANRLVYRKKVDANAAWKSLEKCNAQLYRLQSEFSQLSTDVIDRMERYSEVVIPLDPDDPDAALLPVREEHRSLDNLISALKREFESEFLRISLERAAIWPEKKPDARKSDPVPNLDARAMLVAAKVAEIYMHLRNGKIPGYAKDDDNRPSSPYTKAVDKVFKTLGITEPTFRRPCKFIVHEIKAQRALAVLRLKE